MIGQLPARISLVDNTFMNRTTCPMNRETPIPITHCPEGQVRRIAGG